MKIEHSKEKNDFLSFYFETYVDGVLMYETVIYYDAKTAWVTNQQTQEAHVFSAIGDSDEAVLKFIQDAVSKIALDENE